MNLTPEERTVGRENFAEAVGVSRRDFLKGTLAAGVTSGTGLGAMYFGYGKSVRHPVRVGIIGTGDEGSILIGAISSEYIQVVAIADIRPYNIHRAFHGDYQSEGTLKVRPGLMAKYGWNSREKAEQEVAVYREDYKDLIDDPDVEAVIIALPLHLHKQVAIEAMQAGKHVLTEKLMAHNVTQCKEMARVAEQTGLLLATGHQRHYSVLYDNAVNLIHWGLLGEIHHIRAQWHRGNLPGRDSWHPPLPGGEKLGEETIDDILNRLKGFKASLKKERNPSRVAMLEKRIAQWTAWDSDKGVNAEDYGYQTTTLSDGRQRTALEELCRWRLWDRTGGGLMAELGSHQLDAASIFVSALRADGKKAHPLTVHATGGRHLFPADRDADDHVYCMFEFPGPGYEVGFDPGYRDKFAGVPDPKTGIPSYEGDPNKKIVVTYSSIMGNGFGGYGETVMGSKGTLLLERESEVMLFSGSSTSTRVKVRDDQGGPTLDTTESGAGPAAAVAQAAGGPVSRGYTEEMEHWAWCIRNEAPENQPRCHPEVALADAVIALVAKLAIKRAGDGRGGYVQFDKQWFDIHSDKSPEMDLA